MKKGSLTISELITKLKELEDRGFGEYRTNCDDDGNIKDVMIEGENAILY